MKKKNLSALVLAMTIMIFFISQPNIFAYNTGDDYPAKYKNKNLDAVADEWNFYNRECTSFVAWCLNSRNGVAFTNWYKGKQWGNAATWGTVAKNLGITVNNTPSVGSVAWWNTGTYGHVAWVEAVNGNNVTIEEYNVPAYSGNYNRRTISKSSPTGYIHIKDIGTVPEKNTWVKTDKSFYNVGETVKFTFEYKYGTSVSLGIDRNGSRYATPDVTGKSSYSRSFLEPGTYSVYVSGWSQNGYEDSPKVTFIVDSGVSSSDTWIKADKTMCYIGETVNFTFAYKYTTSVSLGIDKEWTRYANPEVTGKTSYSTSFPQPGTYSVYVSGWSHSGYEDSGKIYITVKEKPTEIKSSIEVFSKTYIIKTSISNLKQPADLITVLYSNNGQILDVSMSRLESGATVSSADLSKKDNAGYIKVFLWDNVNNVIPLSESERINI